MWIPISEAPIACFPHFEVAAESGDWIVVDKGAPLIVHPSNGKKEPCLLEGVEALLSYEIANGAALSLVNRLDRETSGLTLVAKHKRAARELGRAMQRRLIHKEYLAIVQEWPEWTETACTAPILRQGEVAESRIWVKQAVHPAGKACTTVSGKNGHGIHAGAPWRWSGAFRKRDACTRYACIWRTWDIPSWVTKFTARPNIAIWNTSSTDGAGNWRSGWFCRATRCMPAGWNFRLMKKPSPRKPPCRKTCGYCLKPGISKKLRQMTGMTSSRSKRTFARRAYLSASSFR